MIRSLSPIQRRQAQPSPLDLGSLFSQHKELQKLREETLTKHDELISKVDAQLKKLDEVIASVKVPAKGDKGDMPKPGVHFPIPRNGADGRDGKDGETPIIDYPKVAAIAAQLIVVPKQEKIKVPDEKSIIQKVIESFTQGKTKLHVKHLDGFSEGLEQTIGPIRSLAAGFRGGGDTVAAGSGVTITNSNGVKTISASGGGFTTLASTETPNGNLQVFTFATATAQPSYLVVDNVWMKPTSKAGTVNWTWNAGAKQATFQGVYAPVDDIFGIV